VVSPPLHPDRRVVAAVVFGHLERVVVKPVDTASRFFPDCVTHPFVCCGIHIIKSKTKRPPSQG